MPGSFLLGFLAQQHGSKGRDQGINMVFDVGAADAAAFRRGYGARGCWHQRCVRLRGAVSFYRYAQRIAGPDRHHLCHPSRIGH